TPIVNQAPQNQFNPTSTNETLIDGNNAAAWTNIQPQPVTFLPL
ncbi:unnamed protein product, partial [Rotaria magnacalcarata]